MLLGLQSGCPGQRQRAAIDASCVDSGLKDLQTASACQLDFSTRDILPCTSTRKRAMQKYSKGDAGQLQAAGMTTSSSVSNSKPITCKPAVQAVETVHCGSKVQQLTACSLFGNELYPLPACVGGVQALISMQSDCLSATGRLFSLNSWYSVLEVLGWMLVASTTTGDRAETPASTSD